jgi:hypothetical protein
VTFALTKIQPPHPHAGFVVRPRLDASLSQGIATQHLVLVCVPAGFGKTALLSRQVGLLEVLTVQAWISVDEDDNLARFAGCLVAAPEALDLPWRTSPDAMLAALDGGRAGRTAFAAGWVNALPAAQIRRGEMADEVTGLRQRAAQGEPDPVRTARASTMPICRSPDTTTWRCHEPRVGAPTAWPTRSRGLVPLKLGASSLTAPWPGRGRAIRYIRSFLFWRAPACGETRQPANLRPAFATRVRVTACRKTLKEQIHA